jgi:hypothetical protein
MIGSNQIEKPFLRRHWLLTFIIIYNAVNLFVFCLYNAAIFDPWQFIGIFMFLIAGPVFAIVSLIILIKDLIKKKRDLNFRLSIICLTSVIIWSFGIKWISYYGPTMAFKLVAKHNEKQVIKAIRNMKDPNMVIVSKFRYPYFGMSTFGHYDNGALFLIVSSAPGPKDNIIYDPT